MISHDAASADSLLTANAELRGALQVAEAELEAARKVVEAARVACEKSLFDGRGPLVTEIARYDWAVQKARLS